MSNMTIDSILVDTENILSQAAEIINELNLSKTPVIAFTDEEFQEVFLQKENSSGSSLKVILDTSEIRFNSGGFTASMTTKTIKDSDGDAFLESGISIIMSEQALKEDTVNFIGMQRAIEVFVESYIRGLEVMYRPSTGTL